MGKPRIFISHSARDDARALTLLFALEKRLKDEQFDVQLDRKCLEVGDSWEHKIGTWLDSCHAAVVLFTSSALKSPYVKFEVSNLLHRWNRSGGATGIFYLLPVLVEPVTDDQLRDFYDAIQLWKIQRLQPADDTVIIDTIVDKLEPLKAGGLPEGIDERLRGHIAALLKRVDDPTYLADVATQLGTESQEWAVLEVAERFADVLIASSMADRWDAVRYLGPRLPDAGLTRRLFDLLMPCWVGPESARALDEVSRADAGQRCALVNARALPFTPAMYLYRAKSQRDLAGEVVDIGTDSLTVDVEGSLRERVRAVLKERLGVDESDPFYPITLEDVLGKRPEDQPVIVSMKADSRVLAALPAVAATRDLEKATFVALMDTVAEDLQVPGVTILHPLLPKTLEGSTYKLHRDYERQLNALDATPRKV